MARRNRPAAERFWEKVKIIEDDSEACWEWQAAIGADGYGRFYTGNDRNKKANRIAWELTYSKIPQGIWVLHRCDNPLCVRPSHLFLGTPADNTADMMMKGRHRHYAKLTGEQAIQIFRADGLQREIAAKFNINRATVSLIKGGKVWSHITGATAQ